MTAKVEWALIAIGCVLAAYLVLRDSAIPSEPREFDAPAYFIQHDILSVPLREIDQ